MAEHSTVAPQERQVLIMSNGAVPPVSFVRVLLFNLAWPAKPVNEAHSMSSSIMISNVDMYLPNQAYEVYKLEKFE